MAIKLKNKYLSTAAFVLGIYMLALAFLSGIDVIYHRRFIPENPYFNSYEFKSELQDFFYTVESYHIDFKGYPLNLDEAEISAGEINILQEHYRDIAMELESQIQKNYSRYIEEAKSFGNDERIAQLIEERDAEIKEVYEENTKPLDEIKKEIVKDKNNKYEEIKKRLSTQGKFIKYYINDLENGQVYTNLEQAKNINIEESYAKATSLYSIKFPQEFRDPYLREINNNFKRHQLSGYFIIPKEAQGYSPVRSDLEYYNSIRRRILKEIVILAISSTLAISLFLYLKIKAGWDLKPPEKLVKLYRKIPIDMRAFIFIIYSFIMITYGKSISFFYKPLGLDHGLKLSFTVLYVLYILFNVKEVMALKNNKLELKAQWDHSLIYQFRRMIADSFISKNTMFKVALILMLTALLGPFALIGLYGLHQGSIFIFISLFYAFIYMVAVIPYTLKKIGLFNKIVKGTEEIVSGNLNYTIEEKGSGPLLKLAHNINNMKSGFKKSLENQTKSERLKSELITNVSHDLKTPLTSIINYVDLLKKEGLSKDEMKSYIEILDRKSQRLKVLIDDLFEASKMASGAVELNIEKVDVASLLNQALAEYDEKIKQSSLTFKVNIEKPKIYASLDGRKTWRVFDNLINNALKYSLPNTRVYISLEEEKNKVIFTIKNISAYEMDFDVEEIFERFKRGDQSRNTDGSGLGLAIAKSIVELQDGHLNIEIDGDLFKATIIFYQ